MISMLKKRFFRPFLVFTPLTLLAILASFNIQPVALYTAATSVLFGWITWTFIEYTAHRFPLHAAQGNNFWQKLMSGCHAEHHRNPDNLEDVTLSLWLSIPLYLFFALSPGLLTGQFTAGVFWATGIALGYLIYEVIHLVVHAKGFKWVRLKSLRRHHMVHHFRDENLNFGVSTEIWDKVFRTRTGSQN